MIFPLMTSTSVTLQQPLECFEHARQEGAGEEMEASVRGAVEAT
jgi:hypothetical protein